MEVGFVVYGGLDGCSGGYRYDRALVEYLESRGDDVDVIALPRRSTLGTMADAVSRAMRRRLDRPVDVLLQDELCHRVLWRHNRRLTGPAAIVTIVHLLRSADPTTNRPTLARVFERRYLESVDGAICPSHATRTATAELASIPATVAYPAGRHEGAATDASMRWTGASSEPLQIAFVGNVIPRKGVIPLLTALSDLSGEWRATIVGSLDADPSYGKRVRRRAEAHEFMDRIDVTGAVSDDRLERVLSQADVLAAPSLRESFGMVSLEAMEHGTVPVTTTAGGPSEFVVDGYNGRLVPPGDAVALRAALSELLEDRRLLASLADGALATADAHPTWSASMSRVRQFMRSTVDPGVDPPPSVVSSPGVDGLSDVGSSPAGEYAGERTGHGGVPDPAAGGKTGDTNEPDVDGEQ